MQTTFKAVFKMLLSALLINVAFAAQRVVVCEMPYGES
jgi:hypothetical protein